MTELRTRRKGVFRLFLCCAIAAASGFGGLAYELVCLRRTALALGFGSAGQGLVFAAFLLGMGVGGVVLPRLRFWKRAPLRWAGVLYALVGFSIFALDPLLASAGAGGRLGVATQLVCFAVPFLLSFGMGAAYPLLFVAVEEANSPETRGRGVGLIQAANLLGSVLAGGLAAAWLVPDLGQSATAWIAGACYLAGSVVALAASASRADDSGAQAARSPQVVPEWGQAPRARRLSLQRSEIFALAAAGFTVLGIELWMPRRLVFALGGFLPTLAGSLVGVLAGLALGGLLVELLWRKRRLPGLQALALVSCGGVVLSIAAVELAVPWLGDLVLNGFWQRFVVASVVPGLLVLPASAALGMFVPRAILARGAVQDDAVQDDAARRAGEAFFAFSLGALAAAFLLPMIAWTQLGIRIWPAFACLPLLGVIAQRSVGVKRRRSDLQALLAFFALAGVCAWAHQEPLLHGARNFDARLRRVFGEASDRVTSASVVHDRSSGELLLYTDEFTAAGGEHSGYMRALGLLVGRFAPSEGGRTLICLGTGTTAAAMARAEPKKSMTIVEISDAVIRLQKSFRDNYDSFRTRARYATIDGRRYLEDREAQSLGAITLEPLLPQAPGSVHLYSDGFYRAARRALRRDGVLVQWIPTHAVDAGAYRALLASSVEHFEHHRLYLLDESTLLVLSNAPLEPREVADAAAIDRWMCGLWHPVDWDLARVELPAADTRSAWGRVTDDRPFLERRAFAPARELLSWLPGNLEVFAQESKPGADASAARIRAARRERMRARIALARAVLEAGRLDEAAAAITAARRLVPESLLLRRESARIEARRAQRDGLRLLATGRLRSAGKSMARALALEASTPLREVARVVALWGDGARKLADTELAAVVDRLGDPRALSAIERRRERGFAALWEDAALAGRIEELVRTRGAGPILPAARAIDALKREDPRFDALLRVRPRETRFRVVRALARGDLEGTKLGTRLDTVLAQLELEELELLAPWIERARNARLRRTASLWPRVSGRPRWWREKRACLERWGRAAPGDEAWAEVVRAFGLEGAAAEEAQTRVARATRLAVLRARYLGKDE